MLHQDVCERASRTASELDMKHCHKTNTKASSPNLALQPGEWWGFLIWPWGERSMKHFHVNNYSDLLMLTFKGIARGFWVSISDKPGEHLPHRHMIGHVVHHTHKKNVIHVIDDTVNFFPGLFLRGYLRRWFFINDKITSAKPASHLGNPFGLTVSCDTTGCPRSLHTYGKITLFSKTSSM